MTAGSDFPEIESFNLADLDVAVLDVRLELASLIPACLLIDCLGNCGHDCGVHCGTLTGKGACNLDL